MTQSARDETRERGVTLAIEAAGGVGPLARKLGISQPSVSGWSRIPADRVVAVEAATGVSRTQLRPDLYGEAGSPVLPAPANEDVDPVAEARSRQYLLLAALLVAPPKQLLLDQIGEIRGDVTTLGMAHIGLAAAARKSSESDAGAEYFRLFVGVGRGELLPYASFYRTGFLNERPLARVRQDLARLGVERAAGVFEPEDHVSTLLEVMAGLIAGRIPGGSKEADAFFTAHIAPWARRFFADLAVAEGALFYRAVAEVGRAWTDIEAASLELPD
ncbi:MAG: molecular chaperone TorD family protein [Hyphomicrobiaceae bacterium]|nr:molecular chaperone TorD family protein [Hyphomicrobiaceae bacterium]